MDRATDRLSLLQAAGAIGCRLGADILQQYGNNGHAGKSHHHIGWMIVLITIIYSCWT